ncbi:HEAT repeat domain-containing protein [Streptomyces fructofermentans]|uniref:HEAT repeat domain-containing protein n=1 Tax=Streptomyces fructofermentans TaxID=152141 RepID=A0A918NMB5_9ACTN|nr:HEAT repeat domain-containing protein [Streptomyces fructofermentans]GGX80663.1 hypothetical protein GCM10010515_55490 [Streptomyces fructofermentans]
MGPTHQIAFFLRELEGADTGRRAAAAKGLGRLGRPEHASVLVRASVDPAPEVRAAAALGLGRLGVPEAGERVLHVLMADADPRVRREASLAANRLRSDSDSFVRACALLLRDPDHHLRINALVGLARLRVPGDVPALVALLGDPEGAVWGRAWSLIHVLRDDPAVRDEVIRTAREGDGAARVRVLELLPGWCSERLVDSLLTGLCDPSAEVRIAVARRMSDMEAPGVGQALAARLHAERDAAVAARLLGVLGHRGDRRVVDPALRWLRDPVAGPDAARALGAVDTGPAVDRLRAAVTDTTMPGPTRAAAAAAVGLCGRWDAVWLLLPLLRDPAAEVRAGAVDGLGTLVHNGLRPWERRPVARALVARLTGDTDTVWRTGHALAGLAEALPALRRLSDDASAGEVRAVALSLLAPEDRDSPGDGAEDDVRRLVRGLDDGHELVRYHAALGLERWLARCGTPMADRAAVHDRLTDLARDPSPRLRQAATAALRALADCRSD